MGNSMHERTIPIGEFPYDFKRSLGLLDTPRPIFTDEQKYILDEKKYSRRKAYWELKFKIFSLLENRCTICGFSDWRALQVDHVNGGGNKERKANNNNNNTWGFYKRILEEIEAGSKDYQLLCANCNWIKKWEKNER